ncbi:MAG: hypothetical protein KAX57_03485 [Rhodoferax sp.]|jgi:hypothetical protein|uniref:hypothetical protein n=1 Tax=Rhodoferax sp. TaxID=50421 RepID=UPI001B568A63|nr:hypothetical protein [Rhodoferax sp.]MBP8285882.1 hypothetical protein [Rhodoferax sp.]MBP9734311.1 hypothetical protein [Rhodoferax sp.]
MKLPEVTVESLRAIGAKVEHNNGLFIVSAPGEVFKTRDLSSITWANLRALEMAVSRRWNMRRATEPMC